MQTWVFTRAQCTLHSVSATLLQPVSTENPLTFADERTSLARTLRASIATVIRNSSGARRAQPQIFP